MRRLPGGFFTSLLLRLDEHSLHTLAVVTSGIERILPDVVAVTFKAVNSISGLPSANEFTRTPVGEVIVTFNKAINPATFDYHDLTMMHEGATVDLSGIQISDPLDNSNESSTFKFDLSSLTTLDGYYSLAVQTAEIDDAQGYHGETGKTCGWIQLTDGQCNLTVKVSPEGAGTVTPGTAKHDYYSNVDMTATANEGYTFVRWTKNDEMLSDERQFTYAMAGPATLVAEFSPKQYKIEVNIVDEDGNPTDMGTIEGGSGLYDYNHQLVMKAKANEGYYFVGWKHAGTMLSTDNELTVTVTQADSYEAVFGVLAFVEAQLSELSADNVSVSSRVYNLQGVYMGDDLNRLPAGMYIVNGKKTVKR